MRAPGQAPAVPAVRAAPAGRAARAAAEALRKRAAVLTTGPLPPAADEAIAGDLARLLGVLARA